MSHKKVIAIFLIVLSLSAFTFLQNINWKAKEEYSIQFDKISFRGLKASILFDEANPQKAKISAFIDPRTIETGIGLKNKHAREALDTDKYPAIIFTSTSVKSLGNSRYEATGNLTIKGITKEIKMPFAFDSKKNLIDKVPFVLAETFSGVITIVPKDFNITRMGTPDVVSVQITVPVTK